MIPQETYAIIGAILGIPLGIIFLVFFLKVEIRIKTIFLSSIYGLAFGFFLSLVGFALLFGVGLFFKYRKFFEKPRFKRKTVIKISEEEFEKLKKEYFDRRLEENEKGNEEYRKRVEDIPC